MQRALWKAKLGFSLVLDYLSMKMTRRLICLVALLLGLIGAACATNAMVTHLGETRLAWAPEDGCVPGASHTYRCPLKMDCYPHTAFAKGGYCDCNPLFINTPNKLPFDDSEWDDGFNSKDCKSWSFVKFILGAFHLYCLIWAAAFVHTGSLLVRELKRAKALKWNAATSSLFFSCIGAIATFLCFAVYWLETWDLEPEYFYNRRWIVFLFGLNFATMSCDIEIGVNWIDLYDRTMIHKMSQHSSRALRVLRWTMRAIEIGVTYHVISGMLSGTIGGILNSVIYPCIISGVFISIAAFLIVRAICPNTNDTLKTNWKLAKAIKRTTIYAVLGKCTEIIGLLGMGYTGKNPTLSYAYAFFNPLYFWGYLFRLWAYIGYIIVSNRGNIRIYEDDHVSPFFGFSSLHFSKKVEETVRRARSTHRRTTKLINQKVDNAAATARRATRLLSAMPKKP